MNISKEDSDEMFETIVLDPDSWVDEARLLMGSARLSWDALMEVSKSNLSQPDRSQSILSYMQSYMMLSGFAIENVIKGLHVARLPIPRSMNDLLSKKIFRHDLLKIVPPDVSLSPQEIELLARLETFTVWAGRYPLPKRSDEYHKAVVKNEVSVGGQDNQLIAQMFFKFCDLIANELDNDELA